jgi:hypothetical protein
VHTNITPSALVTAALACLPVGCGQAHEATLPAPRLAAFDAPPTAEDRVSHEVATALAQSLRPEFSSQDIRAARRVLLDHPGWLVPAANGEVCLVHVVYPTVSELGGATLPPATAHACAPESAALGEGIVESQSLTSGTYARTARIVGVVPNDVGTVTITSRAGVRTAATVIRNAYEAVIQEPVAISFVVHRHGRLYTHVVGVRVVHARSRSPVDRPTY